MLLQEILEDVDTLVPNSFTAEKKIRWINQIQREWYRNYVFSGDATVYSFKTVVGQQAYTLPKACQMEGIQSVAIGTQLYDQAGIEDIVEYDGIDKTVHYYTVYQGKLVIVPDPTAIDTAYIYYHPRPTDLTIADLSKIPPDFPEDFQEVLVKGCAWRTAQSAQRFDLAQLYAGEYQMMARQAAIKMRDSKPFQVKAHW